MVIVEVFISADKQQKVEIFQRDDGTFGFEWLKWGEFEQSWFPVATPSSRTATKQDAILVAQGKISWLAS